MTTSAWAAAMAALLAGSVLLSQRPDHRAPVRTMSPTQAHRLASSATQSVALPQGGNFNGIRWSSIGPVDRPTFEGFLTYNAVCQWLRALHGGREVAAARRAIARLLRRPALGDRRTRAAVRAAMATSSRRGPGRDLVRRCVESHEREVRWAQAQHLPASA